MSRHIEFEFDLLTEEGHLIAECIQFCADVINEGGSYACTNVEIETAVRTPEGHFAGGHSVWVDLPQDLKPYFDRWQHLDSSQSWLAQLWADNEPEPYD